MLVAVGVDEVVEPDVLKGDDWGVVEGALNANNPDVVLGVVLELDGVLPKLKFVVLPDVDELGVEVVLKLKESLFSGLFVLLVVALLNGLRGLELSDVEDVVVVVVPNGEVIFPVVPNTVEPFGFPNEVVPNVPPVAPNAGLGLLGFVPKDEVVPLEVPVPNAEPVFAFAPNGEVVVPPPIPNPVLVASLTAAAVPPPPLVPKVGPKANFGAGTPLVLDVLVPVEPGVVVCLKSNTGFCVSFFSTGAVVVIAALAGVVVAAGLLKLKENFGVVVAPIVLEDVPVAIVVFVVVAVGVGNALTG